MQDEATMDGGGLEAAASGKGRDGAARRRRRGKRDALGSVIGLLVFLGGVALLLLVFRLAYSMFETPPSVSLQLQGGKAVDLASASDNLSKIIIRVVLLVLMALTGSLVANRGILLYARSVGRKV